MYFESRNNAQVKKSGLQIVTQKRNKEKNEKSRTAVLTM